MTYYKYDINPEDLKRIQSNAKVLAIDTETLGLNIQRDRLCLVQLRWKDSNDKSHVYLIHFPTAKYNESKNLQALLSDEKIKKVFHFGRFDIAVLYKYLNVLCINVFCTKIASYISRTYSNSHSLKELCKIFKGINLSKAQQQSSWNSSSLTNAQMDYAHNDVEYLEDIMNSLQEDIIKEKRNHILQPILQHLPYRAMQDVEGWEDIDFFAFIHNQY